MNKEYINEINRILNIKDIDDRIKPIIKLYFIGKSNELSIEQLGTQIDLLCSRIANVEFSTSDIVIGYSSKSNVLTINKQLFLDGKSDEALLPIFMKFESALNQNNRSDYANYIEDFIKAGRIAKKASVPISDRLYKLYEIAEYCYEDNKNDPSWKAICSKYNNALNNMIVTGKDNSEGILNAANLFHYETYTSEVLENPNFEGNYNNEEYQKKAARILGYLNDININANIEDKESLVRNIKLFTGCTQEMIEREKVTTYTGNNKIGMAIQSAIQSDQMKISEEFIVSKVEAMIDRKPDYDSRIKHLIIPFFIRSQKIYNWDIDEFQERLNEIDLKVDKILFEDFENITCMGDTSKDRIRFNSRIFFDRKRSADLAYISNLLS